MMVEQIDFPAPDANVLPQCIMSLVYYYTRSPPKYNARRRH